MRQRRIPSQYSLDDLEHDLVALLNERGLPIQKANLNPTIVIQNEKRLAAVKQSILANLNLPLVSRNRS